MMSLLNKKEYLPLYIGEIDSDTAVLFIHGLAGSYWTWKTFSKYLKEAWTDSESFGLAYEQYYGDESFIYYIPFLHYIPRFFKVLFGPDIYTISETIESTIDVVCSKYDNVIIVSHSMGGLVARRYIIDYLKKYYNVGKIRGLITYATPHLGSNIANQFSFLGFILFSILFITALLVGGAFLSMTSLKYSFIGICIIILAIFLLRKFRSKIAGQLFQLKKGNKFIEKLNDEWRDKNVDNKLDFHRVVGLEDWVVDVKSASFLNDKGVIKGANKGHFSIIKPERPDDKAFMVTYNYLKKFRHYLEKRKELEEFELTEEI